MSSGSSDASSSSSSSQSEELLQHSAKLDKRSVKASSAMKHSNKKRMVKEKNDENSDDGVGDDSSERGIVNQEQDEQLQSSSRRKRRKKSFSPLPSPDLDAPAPLSHKAKRKTLKMEQEAAKKKGKDSTNNIETAQLPVKNANSNEKEARKGQFGVWVGNLSFSTTKDKLAGYFKDCGTITRLHLPKGVKKIEANRGFAYVDFNTEEENNNAIALSEGHLDGRRLLIKNASDFSGRPSRTAEGAQPLLPALTKFGRKVLDRQKNDAVACLFVGNLSFNTEQEDLYKMFGAHYITRIRPKKSKDNSAESDGNNISSSPGVRQIRMGTFEDTGKCKGWAFVDFETVEQATDALTDARNHRLDGRELQLEYASADATKRGMSKADRRKPQQHHQKTHNKNSSSSNNRNEQSQIKDGTIISAEKRNRSVVEENMSQQAVEEEETEPFVPQKIDLDDPTPLKRHKPNQAERRAARKQKAQSANVNSNTNISSKMKTYDSHDPVEPQLTGSILESKGKRIVFDD